MGLRPNSGLFCFIAKASTVPRGGEKVDIVAPSFFPTGVDRSDFRRQNTFARVPINPFSICGGESHPHA
jgi:hypothetical protein